MRRPLLVAFAVTLAGCHAPLGDDSHAAGGPASDPAEGLRRAFPAHAARVLEGAAFDGELASPAARGLTLRLPAEGSRALTFDLGGASIRVREVGAIGPARRAERAVAYGRRGGTSYWTASAAGLEEWLSFEPGAIPAGLPAARWEIEGAAVTQEGPTVLVRPAGLGKAIRASAPAAFTASGAPVGVHLHAAANAVELFVDPTSEAVLVDPLWVATASMANARSNHTAARLPDGSVLVAGGEAPLPISSAEIWSPGAGTWSTQVSMYVARSRHSSATLGDGRVLVTGGYSTSGTNASSEIFDLSRHMWAGPTNMIAAHAQHVSIYLPARNEVLVCGGFDTNGLVASAEIYDVAADTWIAVDPMASTRFNHKAALLPDGRVLVTGGAVTTGDSTASTEIFDPVTRKWSAGASMMGSRVDHGMAALADGRVVVYGGTEEHGGQGFGLSSTEIYDPAAGTWNASGSLGLSYTQLPLAVRLANGKVFMAGAFPPVTFATLFDPEKGAWSLAGSLTVPRGFHTVTELDDGRALVAGGQSSGGDAVASSELYEPADDGAACSSDGECRSGFCADSVCCDVACDDPCQGCSAAARPGGTDGVCGPLATTACLPPCSIDADCGAAAYCDDTACVDKLALGQASTDSGHCLSGFSADGVCCDATCDGECQACAKAGGAVLDGQCSPLSGMACSSAGACVEGATCQAGVCAGGSPVVCAPLDDCHVAGVCDATLGACSNPSALDGAPCTAAGGAGSCVAGACVADPIEGGNGAGSTTVTSGSSASSSGAATSAASSGAGGAAPGSGGGGGGGGEPELGGGACALVATSAGDASFIRVAGLLALAGGLARRRRGRGAQR